MCGRFAIFAGDDELVALFGIDIMEGEHGSAYNQAPGQLVRTVIGDSPRVLTLQQWGLLPSWSKPGFHPLINARAETITEKPSFRAAAMRRRCLIPANGYYEWAVAAGHKQPYFLSGRGDPIVAMAGLSEVVYGPDGEEIHSCAVITREATDAVGHVHPRMPLFVPADFWSEWLDPQMQDRERVRALVEAIPPAQIESRTVLPAVGNVRTTDPRLIFG